MQKTRDARIAAKTHKHERSWLLPPRQMIVQPSPKRRSERERSGQFSVMHVLPVQVPLPQHTCSSSESAPSSLQQRKMDGCCQGSSFSLSGRSDPSEPGGNIPSQLLTGALLGSFCRKTNFSILCSSLETWIIKVLCKYYIEMKLTLLYKKTDKWFFSMSEIKLTKSLHTFQ